MENNKFQHLHISLLKQTLIFACLVLFIINTSYANTLDDIIKITEEAFDVRVITDTSTLEKSWEEISYNPPTDTSHLLIYLVLLNAELNKYPANYISNTGVKKMVLCSNLYYKDQNRAAIPDPYNNTLYFAIDSFYETEYLIHVIHHELHHVTE